MKVSRSDTLMTKEHAAERDEPEEGNTRADRVRLLIMAVAAVSSGLGVWHASSPHDVVAVAATLLGGYPVYVETLRSLSHRHINMEVSMTIAIVASSSLAILPAVVITFFVLLSEYIETFAVDRGRATIVNWKNLSQGRLWSEGMETRLRWDCRRSGSGKSWSSDTGKGFLSTGSW